MQESVQSDHSSSGQWEGVEAVRTLVVGAWPAAHKRFPSEALPEADAEAVRRHGRAEVLGVPSAAGKPAEAAVGMPEPQALADHP